MARKRKKTAKTEPLAPVPPSSLPVPEATAPPDATAPADTTTDAPTDGTIDHRRRGFFIGAGVATVAIVAAAAIYHWTGSSHGALSASPPAQYVGGNACAECHANVQAAWHGSDHDLAMQVADEKSVL